MARLLAGGCHTHSVSQVHLLDVVGLLLAFVTFGFLTSTWLAAGPRGASDEASARRFDNRAMLTGVLAVVTAMVAVITEDPIRVAMFAVLAAVMVMVRTVVRRRRL